MKKSISFFIFFPFLFFSAQATGWVDSTLFSPKLFIENKGQFNGAPFLPDRFPVLYAVDHRSSKVFFSKNKIVFTLHRVVKDADAYAKFQKEEAKGGPQSQ